MVQRGCMYGAAENPYGNPAARAQAAEAGGRRAKRAPTFKPFKLQAFKALRGFGLFPIRDSVTIEI